MEIKFIVEIEENWREENGYYKVDKKKIEMNKKEAKKHLDKTWGVCCIIGFDSDGFTIWPTEKGKYAVEEKIEGKLQKEKIFDSFDDSLSYIKSKRDIKTVKIKNVANYPSEAAKKNKYRVDH
ncbi:hypothetical protein HN865_02170 [Candidatus Woesearchaeota archaeon]|jgi:hypothetical protein|nr:hypothetical protein [Candidatus Woesearchaeota archaeon]